MVKLYVLIINLEPNLERKFIMDLNLRKAILTNIATNDQDELEATIVDAIQNGEEKMLPGLGVLFELIWKQSDEQNKQFMVDALEQSVKQETSSTS